MRIGVIGRGVVGNAIYEGLGHIGNTMSFFDIAWQNSTINDVIDTECVFISVPTNQLDNGDCDTSIVENVINDLSDINYKGLVAIKSTIIPGTTDRLSNIYNNLRICCVPEFLRARIALNDFLHNHDVLVIGSHNTTDFDVIKVAHGDIPKSVMCIKPTEAEIVKYFNNVNHSIQIIFAGITYDVCKELGVDYDSVYNTIIKRECFNPSYLKCDENLLGFGGHCLPKDTAAWGNLIKSLGLNYTTIQSVIDDNHRIKKIKD